MIQLPQTNQVAKRLTDAAKRLVKGFDEQGFGQVQTCDRLAQQIENRIGEMEGKLAAREAGAERRMKLEKDAKVRAKAAAKAAKAQGEAA